MSRLSSPVTRNRNPHKLHESKNGNKVFGTSMGAPKPNVAWLGV
jgi:hypothetical protein